MSEREKSRKALFFLCWYKMEKDTGFHEKFEKNMRKNPIYHNVTHIMAIILSINYSNLQNAKNTGNMC